MECEEVKKEHPLIRFTSCCKLCHDETTLWHNDLWFEINGKNRHVCCMVASAILDSPLYEYLRSR